MPEASVKITSSIVFGKTNAIKDFYFIFENDSLRHRPGKTLRFSQIESWIERLLSDKKKVSKMCNFMTDFESTRIVPSTEDEDEKFYGSCELLEPAIDVDPDEDMDTVTLDLIESLKEVNREIDLRQGASIEKTPGLPISSFNDIAQVLGMTHEIQQRKVEKTAEVKLSEFFFLYPAIKEIDNVAGPVQMAEGVYYFERGESG